MSRNGQSLTRALLLTAAACGPVVPAPAVVGNAGAPAASGPLVAPAALRDVAPAVVTPVDLGAVVVDGFHLGTPVRALLGRDPYLHPCDAGSIDHDAATLYFWSGGTCREAPPFPLRTTVAVVTRKGADPARQPVELVVWAGGHWFDDKTSLPVHIGETASAARQALGPPSKEEPELDLVAPGSEGIMPSVSRLSWQGRLHLLVRDGLVVAVGVGSLEGGDERHRVLSSTYGNHLRFTRAQTPPPAAAPSTP